MIKVFRVVHFIKALVTTGPCLKISNMINSPKPTTKKCLGAMYKGYCKEPLNLA